MKLSELVYSHSMENEEKEKHLSNKMLDPEQIFVFRKEAACCSNNKLFFFKFN